MKFTVLTLFPELVRSWTETGLIGAAFRKSLFQIETLNPRDFATDNHRTVDDSAFGGSDGMVMKFEPMSKAIECVPDSHVVFLTPQGAKWSQAKAVEWNVSHKHLLLVCGRYAGFDQRLIETYANEEISLGDFILNGGEIASLAVMESVVRLIPGVLGNDKSVARESFSDGLLEAPAFTRPREIAGFPVPSPLLSGNHKEIYQFEMDVSIVRTKILRPDLPVANSQCREAARRLTKLSEPELAAMGLSKSLLERLEIR